MSAIPCRLCGGQSTYEFEGPILRKYTVKYYRCAQCESLETEQPYWLDEAYADKSNLLDVGRVQRTQIVAMLAAHILDKLGLKEKGPCLDWGGAEGLLCRMLRDRGFPFLTFDRYADATFTPAYKIDDPASITPVALTSIEVLEHLPEPLEELSEMFRNQPRVLLFTTELNSGEGAGWNYLAPINGRHVFFYTERAMHWIAARFGYRYHRFPLLHVFARDTEPMDELTQRRDELFADAAQSLAAHLSSPDVWRYVGQDFTELRARY